MQFSFDFLFYRLFTFVFVLIFDFLDVGFASWSMASTNVHDLSTGLVMMSVNSIITIGSISGAFVSVFFPRMSAAHVKNELIWTIALSILNLTAMILASIVRPISLRSSDYQIIASTVLFLFVGWLTTLLLLGYTVAFGCVALTHARIYPNLMITSVHSVPWFKNLENHPARVSMLFPRDLNTTFACRSPSWQGTFAGIRMHDGPFAVLTAKRAAEEEAAKIAERSSP